MGSSSSKHYLKENSLDPSELKKKPIIFVLGGPGSGKGTQCDKLVKDFGLQHLSLGDLLRDEVKQGSRIGRESSKLMAEGKLVPTSVSLELLKKAMCGSSSRDCQGYLIDGFPRAIDQATAFHKEVKKPDMVIYLHAPYDVLEKRLLKRGETSGRSDDNMKIIHKRFLTFRKETLPVVALYTSVLKRISSKPPSDEVYNKVHRTVEKLWPNRGGCILNRREAYYEKEISPKTVAKLKRKWQILTKHNVTATPSVSLDGVVYFPSSDGYLYAVCATTGNVIWQKNLTKLTKSPIRIFSRTSVVTKDLLLVAIYGPAIMLAMDRNTGDIVWSTLLDPNPLAVLTMSGTVHKSWFFAGTSSEEEGLGINSVDCCYFQGSFLKLDLITGDIKWRTLMIPDNHGNKHLYSGAAIWGSSPPIDIHRNLVIFATGNLYTTPPNITQCEENQLKEKHPIVPDPCIKPSDHSESVLAQDLDNGTIIWSHHLGGYDTWNINCLQPQNPNCPPIPGPDADFGEAPLLHTILDHNVHPHLKQDLAIVGQKNGFVWALDRNDGHIVWATVAGPAGACWGLATDGQQVYTNIVNYSNLNFTLLPSSEVTNGGGWVAMDAHNGTILWSIATPNNSIAYGPVTVANGVVFVIAYGTPYGTLMALEAISGKILWQYKANSSLAGGVSVVKGCVYMGTGISAVVDAYSIGGLHVDAFCLETHK